VRAQALAAFADAPVQPAAGELPAASGVYAVLDAAGATRYIGISRTISLSVTAHARELGGDVVTGVKVGLVANATKDDLVAAWKEWLQQSVTASGAIPAGNAPGPEKEQWQAKRKPATAKPEIRLTSGKGLGDLTVPVTQLVDMVVSVRGW